MTAMSSAATALTPPSSSHGEAPAWGYPTGRQFESAAIDTAPRFDQAHTSSLSPPNGFTSPPVSGHGFDMSARKIHSVDGLSTARRDKSAGDRVLSPPSMVELKTGRASPCDWPMQSSQIMGDNRQRAKSQTLGKHPQGRNDDSNWIHRDKLAKIENEELQAAGIFVPRSRAARKQMRDRSQSRLGRGNEPLENSQNRARKNSVTIDQTSLTEEATDNATPWDPRSSEEIAQDDANTYFAPNGHKGGSRIPVAKISPAPIPLDYLERGSQAVRKPTDTSDTDTLSYSKPRSRSASLSVRDRTSSAASGPASAPVATAAITRRSGTDMSPKKAAPRKSSAASKSSMSSGRPKTRSEPNKDLASPRPPTRAGDVCAASKAPEGDPPWMANSYTPDPRLPPDQQLLPTVARRLQQEKWEKEGKFGDAYDKEFRPLNDREFLRPPVVPPEHVEAGGHVMSSGDEEQAEEGVNEEEDSDDKERRQRQQQQDQRQQKKQSDEWPLKPSSSKSPAMRQGSYSTMPKISDKLVASPMTSPRAVAAQPVVPVRPSQEAVGNAAADLAQEEEKKRKGGGCACCVVM